MKIDRAKISREVQLGSKWIALEGSLGENESAIDGLAQLDKTIYDYLLRSDGVNFDGFAMGLKVYPQEPAKVINRADERVTLLLDDCKTLDDLKKFKDQCAKEPLYSQYMNKLKELSTLK